MEKGTFAKARGAAQQRILASLSQLHQAFTPLKTPNVRVVLLSLTGAGESGLSTARSIIDVETGFLRRALLRASEQAYRAVRKAHGIALAELANDLGLAHVQAVESIEPSEERGTATGPWSNSSDRAVIENVIYGLASGPFGGHRGDEVAL